MDSNLKAKGKSKAWNVYDIDDSGRKSKRPVVKATREEVSLQAKETIGRMYEKFGDDLKSLSEVFHQHMVNPVAKAL